MGFPFFKEVLCTKCGNLLECSCQRTECILRCRECGSEWDVRELYVTVRPPVNSSENSKFVRRRSQFPPWAQLKENSTFDIDLENIAELNYSCLVETNQFLAGIKGEDYLGIKKEGDLGIKRGGYIGVERGGKR